MSQPLVVIVSPLYNAERFVRTCMESVLAQTYQNWRHIVLDNACTDRTGEIAREIAASDDRVSVVRNEATVPVIENHNLAVGHTPDNARYMRILQGDDVLHPTCLERSVRVAESDPRVGMVGSYLRWGDKLTSNEFAPDKTVFAGADVAARALLGEVYPFLSPSALLFRWDAVRERQPFYDERFLYADVMASYELLAAWDFGVVHDVLVDVGRDEASVTNVQAKPFNRLKASNLNLLVRYGAQFLDADVQSARISNRLEDYYEFLAFALLEGREDAFWDFHRQALREAGEPLSRARLLRCLAAQFALHPRTCFRRWRRSRK